jgi:hypothetical protein
MPRYTNYFTSCAAPGQAAPLEILPAFIGYFLVWGGAAVAAIFAAVIAGAGTVCEYAAVAVWGVGLTLVASLGTLQEWYYTHRLMCVSEDACVIGTVTGKSRAACDGDRKIDLLIAPFRILEVEIKYAYEAAVALASGDLTFPAPPESYQTSRSLRLEYINGPAAGSPEQLPLASRLNDAQRKRLYHEVVFKHLAAAPAGGQPDRRFLLHFFVRDRTKMSQAAFDHSGPDEYDAGDPNPMYRYERESECVTATGEFFSELFCERILGAPSSDASEDRLVPYMHNEIEGDRLGRGIENLQASIAAFMAAYVAACAVCMVIPVVGTLPWVCAAVAGLIGLIFAFLAWLVASIFNDPDDGEAGQISVDLPSGPEIDEGSPEDDVGDLVVVQGRWIMDEEHCNYFELHPVRAWYRIAASPGGDVRLFDDVGQITPGDRQLAASEIDERRHTQICDLVSKAEKSDPVDVLRLQTSRALSMARGIDW